MNNVEPYEICPECGAVTHGNLFCNTCRTVMNERNGWQLPPWEVPAERPCGAADIQPFIDRLTIWNEAASQVLNDHHELWQRLAEEGTAVPE